ncbi:stage II sporulation protein R [bacterium]|nr:stage II sporulation protein R [bacterium]
MILTLLTLNTKASANLIPDEAIRLRVLANSNSEYDQQIKLEIKDQIQIDLYNLLKDTKGIEEARKIIKKNIPNISSKVEKILEQENYQERFSIDFGSHYFPEKEFKGITYEEGYYESLLITLGKGEGNNWWCVLFPPLCLVEAEESDEVEYKFFIKELIDKYL